MDTTKINEALVIATQGQHAEGKRRLRKILKQEPNNAAALYGTGAILYLEHEYGQAIEYLERSLCVEPRNIDSLSIAAICYLKGPKDLARALEYAERALKLAPTHINSLLAAGDIHTALRNVDEARKAYLEVLRQDPDQYAANINLGVLLGTMGRRIEATAYFKHAYEKYPDDPITIGNYISGLNILNLVDELSEILPKVLNGRFGIVAFTMLSIARYLCVWPPTGRLLQEMRALLHDSRAEIPYSTFMQANMPALSIPEIDNAELFLMHRRAGDIAAAMRTTPPIAEHAAAWSNTRKWRIGYLSADFRSHSVSTFLRTLVNDHDRDHFEVYCYSNTMFPDDRTEEYKRVADSYVDVTNLSDLELAARVHADGVHILVDLSGYTLDSRLAALAYRPAPVQMCYLGYPYTSGMAEVDFLVSDPYLEVPENAGLFTEKHLCLPECFLSFGRMDVQPITDEIPCQRNGHITFGSLSNIYKITPDVIGAWAAILDEVPDSRIIINHPKLRAALSRQSILDEFAKHAVNPDRVTLIWEPHPENSHFHYYNDIDIVLDTFPLTGGTTTADAIWMGVPVITLVGDLYHKRISYSIISNIGLDTAETADWCASNVDEYIRKAVRLADQPERLARLRRLIPEKLKTSLLTDQVRLVRQVEEAYIRAWKLKFREAPVDSELTADRMLGYPLAGSNLELFSHDEPADLTGYVLKERKGTWFDPEWQHLQEMTLPADQIIILGAGSGIYALPLGARAHAGKVLCVCKTPNEGRLLEQGIAKNRLANVALMNNGQRKFVLDHEPMLTDGHCDLVILQGSYATTTIFDGGESFFERQDPLVMFALHGSTTEARSIDTSLMEAFIARGYHILRLLPGLNCLAPLEDMNELDALCLNLFACKTPRAERLAETGQLALRDDALKTLPGIHDRDWQELFTERGYGNLLPDWIESQGKPENWEVHWVVLHLYARSLDRSRLPGVRYTNLKTAGNIMAMLTTTHASPWRLASQSVICQALGLRENAVRALDQVCATLIQTPNLELTEPCLLLVNPLSPAKPPQGEPLHAWLFREAVAQRERLRSHTSYFNGGADLPLLDELDKRVGLPEDLERRRQLIRQHLKT